MRSKILALLIALLGATTPGFAQDDISLGYIIGNGRLLGAKTYDGQTTVGILGIDSSGNTVVKSLSGSDVLFPSNLKIANNTYIQARNAAGSADINVLRVDSNDDTVLASDAGDPVDLMPQGDTNRMFIFDATSDTAHSLTFGDAGTTASQILSIGASTADADDDSAIRLLGGGAYATDGTRGAIVEVQGNETGGGYGSARIYSGSSSNSDIVFKVNNTGVNGLLTVTASDNTVVLRQRPSVGDLDLPKAGTTLSLQEATAGAACMGTLTANGATPVVTSTTCAVTGARIFLSRTSAETGVVTAWVSAISNGVSFSITGEAGDTGTYNWIIFKEAA